MKMQYLRGLWVAKLFLPAGNLCTNVGQVKKIKKKSSFTLQCPWFIPYTIKIGSVVRFSKRRKRQILLIMAEKNSSNDGQYFLQSKHFIDFRQNETDTVDSAMDVATRQSASTKKKIHIHQGLGSRKTSKNIKRKMSKASQDLKRTSKTAAKPQKQRLSQSFKIRNIPEKKFDKFPQAGVSRKQDGKFRTITIKKEAQCRLRTALKLLDILEGKYDDSDRECSLDSKSLHGSVKRNTRRLQTMQDLPPRDFFGLCRDCRSRCRNCGRRPSAVLMARRKRYS